MSETIRISVDAMGGDKGPRVVVEGARLALDERSQHQFHLPRPREELTPLLDQFPELKLVSPSSTPRRHPDGRQAEPGAAQGPRHLLDVVGAAVGQGRRGRRRHFGRQYRRADGHGDVLPAGPSRAFRGRQSPPSGRRCASDIVVLDVGATIDDDAEQLVDFSILGRRAGAHPVRPGIAERRAAQRRQRGSEGARPHQGGGADAGGAKDAGFTYHGFVEGDDIGKGTVDVVVTDGFTGNIALKTAEGTARQVGTYLRMALTADPMSKLGALLAGRALQGAAQQDGPAHRQRRRLPRPQRHRHQEPRRHRRDRLQERPRASPTKWRAAT